MHHFQIPLFYWYTQTLGENGCTPNSLNPFNFIENMCKSKKPALLILRCIHQFFIIFIVIFEEFNRCLEFVYCVFLKNKHSHWGPMTKIEKMDPG